MANNIKKTGRRLKQARTEARKLAGGQLAAIQSGSNKQLNKQLRKFDRKSDKLISGMNRFVGNQRQIGAREVRGVVTEGKTIAGRGSATGGHGSVLDYGITGSRRRQAQRDARTLTGVADVSRDQARAETRAGKQAFKGMQRADTAGAKSSATVLDVLAAERRMVDERFLSELREKQKDRRFQVRMMEKQFEMQKEMAVFENELPLAAAAKEQAKLNWRYEKKSQLLEYDMMVKGMKAEQNVKAANLIPEMTSAISVGQDVSAAAQNAYNSPAINGRVDALRAQDPSIARPDALRQVISERAQGLAGNALSPETVNRIVYDVVRNGGQTSSDFVTEAVVGQNPEWIEAASAAGPKLQNWADQGHGMSLATPPDLSVEGMEGGSAVDTLFSNALGVDTMTEEGANKKTRLLSGDVRDAREARERSALLNFFGYDMRSTP